METLDIYIHNNFSSLEAENIGKIIPRWANGGGSSPSVYLKNPGDIVHLIENENSPVNINLTFRKKIKVI